MVKQLQILVVNETWKGEYVYIYIKYKSLVYVLLVIETWSSDKCKTQKSKNGGTKGSSINDVTHVWHFFGNMRDVIYERSLTSKMSQMCFCRSIMLR